MSDFNETWIFSTDLRKKAQIWNVIKIRPVGAEFHADGQTDMLFAVLRTRLKITVNLPALFVVPHGIRTQDSLPMTSHSADSTFLTALKSLRLFRMTCCCCWLRCVPLMATGTVFMFPYCVWPRLTINQIDNWQPSHLFSNLTLWRYFQVTRIFSKIRCIAQLQGGSNMTGTNYHLFTHKSSRSYLNHLVFCRQECCEKNVGPSLLFYTPDCVAYSLGRELAQR